MKCSEHQHASLSLLHLSLGVLEELLVSAGVAAESDLDWAGWLRLLHGPGGSEETVLAGRCPGTASRRPLMHPDLTDPCSPAMVPNVCLLGSRLTLSHLTFGMNFWGC